LKKKDFYQYKTRVGLRQKSGALCAVRFRVQHVLVLNQEFPWVSFGCQQVCMFVVYFPFFWVFKDFFSCFYILRKKKVKTVKRTKNVIFSTFHLFFFCFFIFFSKKKVKTVKITFHLFSALASREPPRISTTRGRAMRNAVVRRQDCSPSATEQARSSTRPVMLAAGT
jgi:hypothetical protein